MPYIIRYVFTTAVLVAGFLVVWPGATGGKVKFVRYRSSGSNIIRSSWIENIIVGYCRYSSGHWSLPFKPWFMLLSVTDPSVPGPSAVHPSQRSRGCSLAQRVAQPTESWREVRDVVENKIERDPLHLASRTACKPLFCTHPIEVCCAPRKLVQKGTAGGPKKRVSANWLWY